MVISVGNQRSFFKRFVNITFPLVITYSVVFYFIVSISDNTCADHEISAKVEQSLSCAFSLCLLAMNRWSH